MLAVLLGIGSIGVCLLGILAPYDIPHSSGSSPTTAPVEQQTVLPPLQSFRAAYLVDLQRPLYDAPRKSPVAVQQPLQIRLAGTIMDPGFSRAVFAAPDGHTELKAVGEISSGARILTITDGSVTVLYNGQTSILHVNKGSQP